jgi:integrase
VFTECLHLKFQVKTEQPKREFLTQKELKKIRKKKIEIERLAIVRDIFLFACYTGLSYADISKLAKHHIRTGNDGKKWIIIDRTKNGSRCRVPLLPFAKNILKRYKNYPINVSKGLLLPVGYSGSFCASDFGVVCASDFGSNCATG